MTEGLDCEPDMVDEPGPGAYQGFAGTDQGKVRLRRLASMLYGRKQFRVEPGQPRQLLGIDLVGFPALGVDELQFSGVGYQHLVTAFSEQTAYPRQRLERCGFGFSVALR